jgi:hypothetical protein|nr:MAG TPA: nuclease [Caudoviricetes sp.]
MRRTMIIIYNEINGVGNISFDGWNEADHPRDDVGRFTHNSGSSFLGREFTGVRGQEAINLLLRERQGFVKDAFWRKDIGGIDLIWGNEDKGLCHILHRRKYPLEKLGEFLNSLAEVIEKGELSFNGKNRFEIYYNHKIAVISPDLDGDKNIKFLLTAFKQKKP